jgi:hypothetical protein
MGKYILKKDRLCPKWLTCKERRDCRHAKPHKRGSDSLSCYPGWICKGGDINLGLSPQPTQWGVTSFPRKPACIDLNVERHTRVWNDEEAAM